MQKESLPAGVIMFEIDPKTLQLRPVLPKTFNGVSTPDEAESDEEQPET